MKMQFKKETKHTVVYETDDDSAAVSQVYVSKLWIRTALGAATPSWPKEIELEVKVAA